MPLDPVRVWVGLSLALMVSGVVAVVVTARTLRWAYRLNRAGIITLEIAERRLLALGHLLREGVRLAVAIQALWVGVLAWGQPAEWTPEVSLLVAMLGSLLVTSLIEHAVRQMVVGLGTQRRRGSKWSRGKRSRERAFQERTGGV